MSTTTQKHRNFVSEPIGDKPVTALPGIGETLGVRLAAKGYDRADTVLGKFLTERRDPVRFGGWLKGASGANSHQAGSCTQGLKEWCDNSM